MRASTFAWLTMMALTALTATALGLGLNAAPRFWFAALAVVSITKGRLILHDFLELRRAGAWRQGIVAGFGAAVLVITAGLLIGG